MIRDAARALVFVLAFLLIVAEVQRYDEVDYTTAESAAQTNF